MRYTRIIPAAAVLLLAAVPAAAQNGRFALEVRGGASLPTEDFGATSLDAGGGFSFALSARVMPHLLAYAGWGWNRLGADVTLPNGDSHLEDTGYAAGFQFQHPVREGLDGWLRAGALYNHIEVESRDGDILEDSGHELGWEVGAGASIAVGRRLALAPGVRYRTFPAKLDLGDGPVDGNLSYLTFDVGVVATFGSAGFVAAR